MVDRESPQNSGISYDDLSTQAQAYVTAYNEIVQNAGENDIIPQIAVLNKEIHTGRYDQDLDNLVTYFKGNGLYMIANLVEQRKIHLSN